jgi:HEAT repeat protein
MKRAIVVLGTWLLTAALAPAADVAELVKQLKDGNADARRAAAEALGKAGKDAREAAPALIAALKDADLYVRAFAAQALGQIDADPKTAVPALDANLKNLREKSEVHEAALASLGKFGAEGVGPLGAVVGDANREPELRRKAVLLLTQIGPPARSTVPMLTDIAANKTKNPKVAGKNSMEQRVDAINALGAIASTEDKEAVDLLVELNGTEKLQRELKKPVADALKKIRERK